MKNLTGLLLICLLISGCAGFHLSWCLKNKDKVCQLCTLKDSLTTTDNTVIMPDQSIPDRNDSALIQFVMNCNALNQALQDSNYQKDQKIKDLSGKITANQPNVNTLVNPPEKIRTIIQHDLKEVENPKNLELQKQNDAYVIKIAKQAVWNSIWRWAAIIGWALIILVLFLKFYFKKI